MRDRGQVARDGAGAQGGHRLRVRLLGPFGVEAGAAAMGADAFARRKAHHLVALVALEPGHRMARDRVLEALWPHLDPERAEHQLYNTLNQARKVLARLTGAPGTDVLALRRGVVALAPPGGVATDVERFTALAEAARRDDTLEALRAAADAYGAGLLPHEPYAEWTMAPRERLRQAFVALALAAAERAEAEGRAPEAAELYDRVLVEDPLREAGYRGRIRILAAAGDEAAAEREYRRCITVLADELGVAPSPETALARLAARPPDGRAPAAPQAHDGSAFVGRRRELEEVLARLADPACRLLTLVGIGGIGKTRLALEAVREHRERTGVEAAVVAVPESCSAEALVAQVGRRLGVRVPAVDAIAQLAAALGDGRTLLVLDNAEHAADAAGVLAELVAQAPGLRVLAASRRRLGLQAEWVVEVHGLEVPRAEAATPHDRFAGVQLFLDAVRRTTGERLAPRELATVGRIGRAVHGVPLALELAASWSAVLTCEEIADRLERAHDLLETHAPDVPERHRSLRRVFEGSWRLLDEAERRCFARLAAFHGPFDLDAAQRVGGTDLAVVRSLAAAMLLARADRGRWTIHPVLRHAALEKLDALDERAAAAAAHAAYLVEALSRFEAASEGAPGSHAALSRRADRPDVELDDLRDAWRHLLDSCDLDRLDACLHGAFVMLETAGWLAEGARLFAAAETHRRVLARIRARHATFVYRLGRNAAAADELTACLALLAPDEPSEETAQVLDRLAVLAHEEGDDERALALLQRALEVRTACGGPAAIATSLNNLGTMSFALGDLAGAEAFCRRSLDLQRAAGDDKAAAISLQNLASVASSAGRAGEAEALLAEALVLARNGGAVSVAAIVRANLGRAAAARGDRVVARDHLLAAVGDALAAGAEGLALEFLAPLAEGREAAGDADGAVALWTLLRAHPRAVPQLRAAAGDHLLRLARALAPERVERAQVLGASLRLDDLRPATTMAPGDGRRPPPTADAEVRG